MTNPSAKRTAGKEGREAAKAGSSRVSPYDGVAALDHLSPSWYEGFDAMMTPDRVARWLQGEKVFIDGEAYIFPDGVDKIRKIYLKR